MARCGRVHHVVVHVIHAVAHVRVHVAPVIVLKAQTVGELRERLCPIVHVVVVVMVVVLHRHILVRLRIGSRRDRDIRHLIETLVHRCIDTEGCVL